MHNFNHFQDEESHHLPNFHSVTDQIFRGGQPPAAGLQPLHQKGIATIINLREEATAIEAERAFAHSIGLQYISIPLRPFDIPTTESIEKFLILIHEKNHQPFFIHCLHGMDRTGLMVGLYRMKYSDWTYERSLEEMLSLGFHQAFQNLSSVLESYARKWGKLHPDCQEPN
ncbi:MAG TPA: tyrosine-protein phosphatase [Candidatus Melainabacteria bacterium]|nr:tyrosine-protein phosphatase [Candidatus Melainabacteria bacterium]